MSKVLDAIAARALSHANAIALSGTGVSLSYRDLHRAIADTAAVLNARCPGGRPIALCADNSPAWVLIELAMVKLGRVLVPLPQFFTPAQRDHAMSGAGAQFLISDTGGAATDALEIMGTRFAVRRLDRVATMLPAGTAKITYTSGTTGQPKGVCLSQDGMEQVSCSLVARIGADYAGVHCAVLPLGVLLENVAGLYTVLLAGGHYLVQPQAKIGFGRSFVPDFAALTDALAASQANTTIVVPEILRGILHTLAARKTGLPQMRLMAVGGARVAPALLDAAAALGVPVYQGYGLSEAASVVTLNTPTDNRPGSVGRALPHIGLRLAGDGEIYLRDPAFLGYAGGGAAPKEYATGDVARIDDDGFIYVEGRKSNVLITGFGRNIAPEWVESELVAQPEIGQALVFGDAMPKLGALIVPSSATVGDAALAQAIARANRALPEYAHIGHWTKVFPFTPANGQLTGNGRLRRDTIHAAHADAMVRCL
jgi:long-subunit acyl-CoA synthetase (AMP-forming)